ncbi:MAG: hypothetical protein ACI89E_000721 [Planctomycetota bacterium]|jgi:hypothetical protein
MICRTPLVLVAVVVLSASSFAQTQRSALSVRIQSTFRAADVNKNGTVSIREAAAAGIPATSFAKHDQNKDRRLSSNEFEQYYQHLMVVRRQDQAKRVAASVAKRRGRTFRPADVKTKPTPVVAPKADVTVGKPVKKQQPVQAKPDQPTLSDVQPAPVMPVAEAKPQANAIPKNREILQSEAVGKRLVKDLQSKGKLSADDAQGMIDALTLPPPGKTQAENFVEWRAALNNARTRIGALVQSKALTAQEGRQMYLLFEQRAKDAIGWQETGGVTQIDPAPTKAGVEKPKEVKGKVAGKVAGKVKPATTKPATTKPATTKPATTKPGLDDNTAARQQAYEAKAAAAKLRHDQQRIRDARARLAEQNAKELAAKNQRLKEEDAKRLAGKKAQKGVSSRKTTLRAPAVKGASSAKVKPATKPAAKPAAAKPAATKPAATKPATTKPAATKPVKRAKKPVGAVQGKQKPANPVKSAKKGS